MTGVQTCALPIYGVNCHRRTLTRWISSYNGPKFTWGNNGEMWYWAKDLPEWVNTYNEQLKVTKRKSINPGSRKKIYMWLTSDNYDEIKSRAEKEKSTMVKLVREAIELRMGAEYVDTYLPEVKKKPGRPKKEITAKELAKLERATGSDSDEAELLTDGFVIDRPLLKRIKKAALKVKLTPNEALLAALNYWLVDVEDA